MLKPLVSLALIAAIAGCGRMDHVGKAPTFSPEMDTREHQAMMSPGLPMDAIEPRTPQEEASLWRRDRMSLLGDRRAMKRGDILTVVISIDDSASIDNSTQRSRGASETMGIPDFLGLPQKVDERLPAGASLANAVSANSNSSSNGSGSVSRSEQLTLRVAATITDVLPNGVLAISGNQEVRVNFELRELLVTGYVRPEDVSRQNEITYDKIAQARISYGGRGQISDVQQPRIGQQIADIILPF